MALSLRTAEPSRDFEDIRINTGPNSYIIMRGRLIQPLDDKVQAVFTRFLKEEEQARKRFNSAEGIITEVVPFFNKHRDIFRNFLKVLQGNDILFGFKIGYITAPLDAIEGCIFLTEGIKGILHSYEKKDLREAIRSALFSSAGLFLIGAGTSWAISEFATKSVAAAATPLIIPFYAAAAGALIAYASFSLYYAAAFQNSLKRALPQNFSQQYCDKEKPSQHTFTNDECSRFLSFLKESITLTEEDIVKLYLDAHDEVRKERPLDRDERLREILQEKVRIAQEKKIFRFSKVTSPGAAQDAVELLKEHFSGDFSTTLQVPERYTIRQKTALQKFGKTLLKASKRNIQDHIVITASHLCWIAIFIVFLAINPPLFSAVFILLWTLALLNGVLTSIYNFRTGKYPRVYRLFKDKIGKVEDPEVALGARS